MAVPIKILLVDDEAEIRRFLEVELSRHRYAVEVAETGAIASKTVNAKLPDLIILDLGLPDMDGKNFIVQVRTWSSVPIIALSARDREDEKIAG